MSYDLETGDYKALAAPFEETFHDNRGGMTFEYLTGEQVISRLNTILGPGGWSFEVIDHGLNTEADEYWVHGRLTAEVDNHVVFRSQFGSAKVKRSRTNNLPLDIGFDLKAATTDCLKKCSSLIGIGLYLSKKEGIPVAGDHTPAQFQAAAPANRSVMGSKTDPLPTGTLACEFCGAVLQDTTFKDGKTFTKEQLATTSRRVAGRILCMKHYSQAKRGELPAPPANGTAPAATTATATPARAELVAAWGKTWNEAYEMQQAGLPITAPQISIQGMNDAQLQEELTSLQARIEKEKVLAEEAPIGQDTIPF